MSKRFDCFLFRFLFRWGVPRGCGTCPAVGGNGEVVPERSPRRAPFFKGADRLDTDPWSVDIG
ncbi:hypothetical protein ACWDBW_24920 [Streptomyces sp. NPDC001107]